MKHYHIESLPFVTITDGYFDSVNEAEWSFLDYMKKYRIRTVKFYVDNVFLYTLNW